MPFLDTGSARAAGYRACKLCRPDDPKPPAHSRARVDSRALVIKYGCGPSPVGFLFVAATERGICALYLLDTADPSDALARLRRDFARATIEADPRTAGTWIPRVVAHLTEGRACDDLPLDLRGTDFQTRVWEALRSIPRGSTTSYGALARSLGLPLGAARAVGTACGANQVSLIVPCHRVVRAGGGLGGYYWGVERKRAILALEGASV